MAYDASNTNDNQNTVSSATPLDQGASPSTQPSVPQGDSTPTPTPITGAQAEASSQGQAQNKKSPKASSGMFTNIQKYVDKNRPQAQKMSTAVQQDTGAQAADIREQAEKKQAQTNAIIESNKGVMQGAQTEASNIVGNIMGTAPQPTQPQPMAPQAPSQEDQISRFQEIAAGDIGASNVQNVNLAQENMKAQALQKLAQGARSEQGRKNLLRQTFQDQGEYNRGMSGLDQLILGGDAGARSSLISGLADQSGQLQQGLGQIGQDTRADVLGYQREKGDFNQGIMDMITGEGGAQSQLDAQIAADLAAEQSKFGAGQQDFIEALRTGEGLTRENLDKYISDDAFQQLGSQLKSRDQQMIDYLKTGGAASTKDPAKFEQLAGMLGLSTDGADPMYGNIEGYESDPGKTVNLQDLLYRESRRNLYGGDGTGYYGEGVRSNLGQALEGRDYSEEAISDYIMSQAGNKDMSGLFSATDPESLREQDIINQSQIDKYSALSKMAGINAPAYMPTKASDRQFNYGTSDLGSLTGLGSEFSAEEQQNFLDSLKDWEEGSTVGDQFSSYRPYSVREK